MIKERDKVKELLRQKVLQGYDPYYDYESAVDHYVDWLVLSREEFDEIKKRAKNDQVVQNQKC